MPGTAPIFANKILGTILTKTAILMQNCIEDDMVRKICKLFRDSVENLRENMNLRSKFC